MVCQRRISNSVLFLAFVVLCILLTSLSLPVHATDVDVDVEDLDDAATATEVAVEETIIEAEEVVAAMETTDAPGGSVVEESSPEEDSSEEATTETDIVEELIAAKEELIAAKEEAKALKKSVMSRVAKVAEKLKSSAVTKENFKKTAALGVGVWGAATGVGWAMQNFGIGPIKD